MAAKKKRVRIVGKFSHPLMNWSDISQDIDGRTTSEISSLQQVSNDSLLMTMKKGKQRSKTKLGMPTSSPNESTVSSRSLGSWHSELKLYMQRCFGRENQEIPANKSNNVTSTSVSEGDLSDFIAKSPFKRRIFYLGEEFHAEKKSGSLKSSLKLKSASSESAANPVKFAPKVTNQIGNMKIKKNVKFNIPKSTNFSSKSSANEISMNKIDVKGNSVIKKSRLQFPAMKTAVFNKNPNLKVQNNGNKGLIAAPQLEPSDEKIEVKINVSESDIEIDANQLKQKIKKKKAFVFQRSAEPKTRAPRKSKKKTLLKANVTTDFDEPNSNAINVDLDDEHVEIEKISSNNNSNDDLDLSRPRILHLNPKEMRKSSSVFKKIDETVNDAQKKVVLMELKPSEVNKSENAWKIASNQLKERFRHENFAYLESSSVPETSEDDKPSNVIKIVSPPANLIVNSQNMRLANLFHQLPIGKIDNLEMNWRMEAMKQLLVGDQDRELLDDIVLKVGNKCYGCCRLLLVLTSRYFRHQLRLGNLEANTTFELELDAADENVRAVLEWMHTANIDINMANIGEILYLCHILSIDSLAAKCQGMLEVLRDHDGDAVSLYEYATENNMGKVAKEAAEIASDNFLKLVHSEKFLDYTYKQVCMLFSMEDIRFNSEVEVFYAVWRWLAHSWDYRKRYRNNLICCVLLDKLSKKEVQCLAGALIEEEWGQENPLTWGTDGYMICGLIRGLLDSKKLRSNSWMKREQAAIVIQRQFRKWAKNKKLRNKAKIKKKKKLRKGMAARIIQAAYNDYKDRKQGKMINQAALEIQRYYRGFATRKAMERRKNAATVIQRAFRKYKDHERRKKLLQLAAPKPQKKKYKRGPGRRKLK